MQERLNLYGVAPEAMAALAAVETYLDGAGLETSLRELVRTRASQINGCAFCLNLHTHSAIKAGETKERLFLLDAWREAPVFTDRERAALEWTESVTLIAQSRAPDDVYERVKAQFTEAEIINLTLQISSINAWNRLSIAARNVPKVRPS
jgi:AhpD family alkylhydroperoxidase